MKKAVIKSLCRKYDLQPKKQRGQNFLIDRKVLDKIIAAADLKKDDIVLEIGPGFGVLTSELAKRVKRVVAVEEDRRLAKALRENLKDYKNVEIIEEDILKFSIPDWIGDNFQFPNKFQIPNSKTKILNIKYEIRDTKFQNYGYKIVANLPYQITSAVFRKFLENEPRPSEMVVMVQKEVAERVCARAGEMSLLSVSVQFFGRPEIVQVVPRSSFWPEPEVDSAILRIVVRRKPPTSILSPEGRGKGEGANFVKIFFRTVKVGFSARRKQLQNNLSAGLRLPNQKIKEILINSGLDPKVRAQDLRVEDWIRLVNQLGSRRL